MTTTKTEQQQMNESNDVIIAKYNEEYREKYDFDVISSDSRALGYIQNGYIYLNTSDCMIDEDDMIEIENRLDKEGFIFIA